MKLCINDNILITYLFSNVEIYIACMINNNDLNIVDHSMIVDHRSY